MPSILARLLYSGGPKVVKCAADVHVVQDHGGFICKQYGTLVKRFRFIGVVSVSYAYPVIRAGGDRS